MQQLCMNKFVSPSTGATISSAQLGILLALVFLPNSSLWGRAAFAFVAAILGTWIFVWFIQHIQFKDVVLVPLVGIMFGNVIGGITNFIAYKYEMTQALSTWLVGHFSMVFAGISLPLDLLSDSLCSVPKTISYCYIFLTSVKLNSTGVSRPNNSTLIVKLCFAGFTV